MKKALISAAAVAALGFAGAAQAQTAVYGLIDIGVKKDFTSDADPAMNSGSNSGSRIGVKSSLDVGDGVKANFKYEGSANAITGKGAEDDGGFFFNRQAWAGLSGSLGEFRYGVQDNVTFDHFIGYDYNGWSNTATSAGLSGTDMWASTEASKPNVLKYIAPTMGPVSASFSYTQADPNDDSSVIAKKAEDIFSAAMTFASGPISASLGYISKGTSLSEDQLFAEDEDASSLITEDYVGAAVQYDFGAFKANVGYHSRGDIASGVQLGAVTTISGVSVGFGYGTESESEGSAYELYASKEIFKGVYAYGEFASADKKTVKGATEGEDVNGYAVGLILTF